MKRAVVLFLVSVAVISVGVGSLFWYHIRVANPCPPESMANGEPATCYYRVQFTGLDDWPRALAVLLLYFAFCVLASWLSVKRGKSSRVS